MNLTSPTNGGKNRISNIEQGILNDEVFPSIFVIPCLLFIGSLYWVLDPLYPFYCPAFRDAFLCPDGGRVLGGGGFFIPRRKYSPVSFRFQFTEILWLVG